MAPDLDVGQHHDLELGLGMDMHVGEQQGTADCAPEMMQPPETSEPTAMPRRPSSSWTNLAGGVISA